MYRYSGEAKHIRDLEDTDFPSLGAAWGPVGVAIAVAPVPEVCMGEGRQRALFGGRKLVVMLPVRAIWCGRGVIPMYEWGAPGAPNG